MLSAGLLRRLNCSLYVSCVHGNETKTRGTPTFGGEDSMPAVVCLHRLCCRHRQPGISSTIKISSTIVPLPTGGDGLLTVCLWRQGKAGKGKETQFPGNPTWQQGGWLAAHLTSCTAACFGQHAPRHAKHFVPQHCNMQHPCSTMRPAGHQHTQTDQHSLRCPCATPLQALATRTQALSCDTGKRLPSIPIKTS